MMLAKILSFHYLISAVSLVFLSITLHELLVLISFRNQLQTTRPLNMFSGQKNSPDSISMDIALFLYMKDCVYN